MSAHVTLPPGLRGAFVITLRVTLGLAILGFSPVSLVEAFEAPKIALLRAVALGLLVAALVSVRTWTAVRGNAVDLAMLLWLAVEAAATVFSVSPRISLLGTPWQHEGLVTSVALGAIYLALRLSHRSISAFRTTLDVFLAAASVAGAYALMQIARLDPMPWARTALYAGDYVRPFGTLGHPNLLGEVAAAACAAGAALLLAERRGRWVFALVVLLGASATVASLSRAAWLGVTIGTALAGVLVWSGGRAPRLSRRGLVLAAAGLALLVAGLAATGAGRLIAARAGELFSGSSGSGASRVEIWRAADAAWRARPWLGHGPDTFEIIFPGFQTPAYWRLEWLGKPFHAHSIVLHTLSTRGVLGLAAAAVLACVLVWAWWHARRGREEARALRTPFVCAAAAVATCGLFGAIGISGALVFVLTAAFLAAALEGVPAGAPRRAAAPAGREAARRDRATRGPEARPMKGGWAAAGAGIAVALCVAWAGLVELQGAYFAQGAVSLSQSAPAQAIVAARLATRTMPFEDLYQRYHVDAALALAAAEPDRSDLREEAGRAAERAVALAPMRPDCHLRVAVVYADRAKRGDSTAIAQMESAYGRVLQRAPVDVMARLVFAQTELRLGRPRDALAVAGQAVSIDSTWAPPYAVIARARLGLGDLAGARAAIGRSLSSDWRGSAPARAEAEQLLLSLEPAPR